MPLYTLIVLLVCVIAAAALTIFAAQGLLSTGEAVTGGLIMAFAMLIRVISDRK